MEPHNVIRSVLFADISDSTGLYEALGDEVARRLVLDCIATMKKVIEACGGTVIDRIGDEILCTFPDAVSAGRASCELHRAIEAAEADAAAKLRIRIGFHHGPIVIEEGRIFGDTIHVAKRVASLAKPQQILTTRQAKDLISPSEQLVMRFVDRTQLKGKVESFELFEIVWDVGAATVTVSSALRAPAGETAPPQLLLQVGDHVHTLGARRPVLSIGRDPQADVFIDHARVSRLHARIEWRRDVFVFIDQSTNGSQVIENGEPPRSVRRDECPLSGEGVIILAPKDSNFSLPAIAYRLAR